MVMTNRFLGMKLWLSITTLPLAMLGCGKSEPSAPSNNVGGTTGLSGRPTNIGGANSANTAMGSGTSSSAGGNSGAGGTTASSSGMGGSVTTSSNAGGGMPNAGGANNAGGAGNRGGTTSGGLSSLGGNVGAAGARISGGASNVGAAGARPGGSGGTAGASTTESIGGAAGTVPAHNGLRGQEFNRDWRFNRGDVTGAEQTTFDDSKWRVLDVPHDWSIELPFSSSSPSGSNGGYLDGGIGWYRKTFSLDQTSADKRILIQFDGVYMNSQVWINGTSLGTRPYGYSSFEYDLTPNVKFDGSNNVVAVKVNNEQPNSRFYSGSGIYRNVWLTTLNAVHVPNSGVFVTTPTVSATSASVTVSTDVQNQGTASASITLSTTITDASGKSVAASDSAATSVAAGATSTVNQSLTLTSPKLWSVASPNLYRVKVEVKTGGATVDTYVTSLGVRNASFSSTSGFSLNGQNMKLQGVNQHHDLGALGAAVNYRAIERQVEILKRMGVNAIRTSHNPPAPELLDIADRLGVLILDEAFDTWTQTKTANDYGKYFNEWAQRDIEDMVRRDRNHPSVILWSIGNEVGGATVATAQKLKDWVLGLDKTRPITWASNKMGGPHVSEGDDRNVAKLLDVVGYNYAPYAGDYDADHTANPNWKLIGTEIAAAVRSRGVYHTPASTITKATSQSNPDRQCSSYDNEAAGFGNTAEISYKYDHDRAFVAGSFIWSGFDYIGEPTPYSAWPSKSSYYGIIDTAGFPKDVYFFYQSRWTTEPMVHLLPHWNWTSGTTVTVYAYSNCDSVELFLNDKSQGSKSLSGSGLRGEWSVPWATGTLRGDCTKGGSVAATDTVKTANAAAKVVLSADRGAIHSDGKDLVFVTADVQDANGVVVPTADNSITFSVTGPGQLVGVDNGNPIDTASYKGTSRKAFSGKALAIVRSTGTAGSIVISASSSNLAPGSVTAAAAP